VNHPRFHVLRYKELPHFYSPSQLKSSKQPCGGAGLPAKINFTYTAKAPYVNIYGRYEALLLNGGAKLYYP
jgi:hypothetical protein